MSSTSVVVVEDEADLRDSMCTFLDALGFEVRGAASAADLEALWNAQTADILVLDVNLPDDSGFAVAQRMRASSRVGIIMLTARSQVNDRIAGLEAGADNYLVKPVNLRELAAAVKGLARRLEPPVEPDDGTLPLPWTLDAVTWSLVAPSGVAVALTAAEFSLMNALSGSPGESVSCDAILCALGKAAVDTNRRSLDSVLSRLRRKVERETGLQLPVKSVRSLGYVFASPLGKTAPGCA
jgi:DNA-binding response OmpR family regulator